MAPVLPVGEFHGEVEARLDFSGYLVAATRRRRGTQVPLHSHGRSSFVSLVEGNHCWTGDDGSIHWSIPGVWYYRPALTVHSHAVCPTEIRSLGFHFEPGLVPELSEGRDELQFDGPDARRLMELTNRALRQPCEASPLWLEGIFRELAGHFVEVAREGKGTPLPAWLEQARIYLDERFQNGATLASVARHVAMHPSHLAREFRRHFGVSVGDYVRDRRLEWAFARIQAGNEKIAEIAAAAGFADHAHFCRVFKGRYGRTPSEVR